MSEIYDKVIRDIEEKTYDYSWAREEYIRRLNELLGSFKQACDKIYNPMPCHRYWIYFNDRPTKVFVIDVNDDSTVTVEFFDDNHQATNVHIDNLKMSQEECVPELLTPASYDNFADYLTERTKDNPEFQKDILKQLEDLFRKCENVHKDQMSLNKLFPKK